MLRGEYLKTINATFTDEEYEQLKKVKGKVSWHNFIMKLAKEVNE